MILKEFTKSLIKYFIREMPRNVLFGKGPRLFKIKEALAYRAGYLKGIVKTN